MALVGVAEIETDIEKDRDLGVVVSSASRSADPAQSGAHVRGFKMCARGKARRSKEENHIPGNIKVPEKEPSNQSIRQPVAPALT